MKKFFLFAAAAVAALTVNAKTVTFSGIIDKESEAGAISSVTDAFGMQNITVSAAQNSDKTAWYAVITQKDASTDWETTALYLNDDDQVYFAFKDGNANKLVAKYYNDYFQPNGKAVCLVISGLKSGDKVTVNIKGALNKEAKVEGATVETTNFTAEANEFEATGEEIRIYSQSLTVDGAGKTTEAKWKLVSVEVPDGAQGIENVNNAVKAEKFFENGQLVIIKNGVRYNALGAQL